MMNGQARRTMDKMMIRIILSAFGTDDDARAKMGSRGS